MRSLTYTYCTCVVAAVLSLLWASVQSSSPGVFLAETFEQDPFLAETWTKSEVEKYLNQPVKFMASTTAPEAYANDMGLQLSQEMRHYGFGTSLPTVHMRDLASDELVLQYEVKFDESLNCGGAYVKLLREGDVKALDGATPYALMFGPDRCGATNKVHFILQHQSPVTMRWEEKHFNESVPVKGDAFTHLYALRLGKSGAFSLYVDNKPVKSGSLLTHMLPPVNPDKEIFDPQDKKPMDWVDEELIEDLTAVKPDDWDEAQPRKVPDSNAQQPADWLEDEPLEIPDPQASKPEDWDEEEDGEWEAPLVRNPKCDQVSGCGPYKPPLIDNPLYKGKWVRPKVKNPLFKGVWQPRLIPNPHFFEDPSPALSAVSFSALAVEVWTTQGGIHFDNFLIAEGTAKEVGDFAQRYQAKRAAEKEKAKKEGGAVEEGGDGNWASYVNMAYGYALDYLQLLAREPLALGATALAIVASVAMTIMFAMGGKKEQGEEEEVEGEKAAGEGAGEDKKEEKQE